MSETKPPQRPRAAVLGFAAVALAGALAYMMWPAASPPPAPSNQPREQYPARAENAKATGPLDVRLEDLKQPPPEPGGDGRNPFRFYVKPPPAPPPVRDVKPAPAPRIPQPGDADYVPPPPPPPPPIPLKFIGTMEQGKKKVAIFSDGRGLPLYASEGEVVLGQYRLVRIGIESVVMEYLDGRGRQTIPMKG